ncbi:MULTISPECIES: hypothetical protein [Cyanophyceae]|uniref:hypothetical protein n=1 Tax=Cyanophyceae TaxID=3028117 RepID=UPI001F553ABC|nr:hypothetical protein [Trichocoleus sp. FACHB-40]
MVVEFESEQIICTAVDTGRTHDFKLLKRSRLPFVSSQLCLADRRYQGFACASSVELVPPPRSDASNL